MLKRFYNLSDEIVNFLNIKNKLKEFHKLNDEQWLNDFSFAVDILSYLNELKLSLQGKGLFTYDMYTNVIRENNLKISDYRKYETNNLFKEFSTKFKDFSNDLLLVSLTICFQCRQYSIGTDK